MTVRQQVLSLLDRRPDLSAARIVEAIPGLSRAASFQYISGHLAPTPNMDKHFERMLRQVEAGDILRVQDSAPVHITEVASTARRVRRKREFYIVETTRRIQQVLTYCGEQSAIGVCTADYGVGKTESIRHWRENEGRKIDHVLFEFDDFTGRNVVDFMSCLAEQLGVSTPVNIHSGGKAMRACIEALEKQPMLLVFDQCEMVAPRILQLIRQMWDKTRYAGVGVVIFASPMLIERLQRSRMRDLGALSSRVGIWAALAGVQKSEAAAILRQEGIKDIDDDAFDLLFRSVNGSMRRLMAITDLLVTKHAGKPVTERTIVGLAQNLWGLELQTRVKAVA